MVGFVLRADAPIVGCGEMVESKEELKGKARRYLYLRADPVIRTIAKVAMAATCQIWKPIGHDKIPRTNVSVFYRFSRPYSKHKSQQLRRPSRPARQRIPRRH
jgi:hypothetical protein